MAANTKMSSSGACAPVPSEMRGGVTRDATKFVVSTQPLSDGRIAMGREATRLPWDHATSATRLDIAVNADRGVGAGLFDVDVHGPAHTGKMRPVDELAVSKVLREAAWLPWNHARFGTMLDIAANADHGVATGLLDVDVHDPGHTDQMKSVGELVDMQFKSLKELKAEFTHALQGMDIAWTQRYAELQTLEAQRWKRRLEHQSREAEIAARDLDVETEGCGPAQEHGGKGGSHMRHLCHWRSSTPLTPEDTTIRQRGMCLRSGRTGVYQVRMVQNATSAAPASGGTAKDDWKVVDRNSRNGKSAGSREARPVRHAPVQGRGNGNGRRY